MTTLIKSKDHLAGPSRRFALFEGGPSSTSKLLPVNQNHAINLAQQARTEVTSETGAFLPDPERAKLGFTGVTATVTFGLLLGATISKNIAAFLEENELFVPSDDDDDD